MSLPSDSTPPRNLVLGLSKIGLALRQEAWSATAGSGLNPTQSQILALLRIRPRRLSELARELGVRRPTASDSAAALVRKGLVARKPVAEDGRGVRLELTARGAHAAREGAHWPDELLGAADELTPEEQGVFLRSLTKIIRRLQIEGRISTARMCATCRFFRPHAHDDGARPHHCAFVDAAFGEVELRLECDEHEPVPEPEAEPLWRSFVSGKTP